MSTWLKITISTIAGIVGIVASFGSVVLVDYLDCGAEVMAMLGLAVVFALFFSLAYGSLPE